MICYRSGGCGPYENRSCNECPASKPEYLLRSAEAIRDNIEKTWPAHKIEAANEMITSVHGRKLNSKKELSHFDMIQEARIEDLAKWFVQVFECGNCPARDYNAICWDRCEDKILEWLKSKAERSEDE